MFRFWNVREWMIAVVAVVIVGLLIALNADILSMTNGNYNIIDILTM